MILKARKILVGLDFSTADDSILTFLADNINAFEASKFSFLHVVEEKVPDETANQLKNEIVSKIMKKIEAKLPIEAQSEVAVEFGKPQDVIRTTVQQEKVDYLIVGNKTEEDKEVKPVELVRKPVCSMIVVPESNPGKVRKIGVPVDFSEMSKFAVQAAVDFSEHEGLEVVGFHSYEVPSGYHKSGMDHREFADVMEKHAKDDAEKFKKSLGLAELPIRYMYQEDSTAAECITQFTSNEAVDLLILGSKGRSGAASFLLDSVAEEVVSSVQRIPIIVVKEKDENMDVIDALKKV